MSCIIAQREGERDVYIKVDISLGFHQTTWIYLTSFLIVMGEHRNLIGRESLFKVSLRTRTLNVTISMPTLLFSLEIIFGANNFLLTIKYALRQASTIQPNVRRSTHCEYWKHVLLRCD